MIKTVTDPITITDIDSDCTIMEKVGERLGRKIIGVEWYGVSGRGVRGTLLLEVRKGGVPEKRPFTAYAKAGLGGAFEIGDKIIPYLEATSNIDNLTDRIDRKLAKDGALVSR